MAQMNTNKLKAKLVERGTNVANLAATIGIDKATLYRKLRSDGETLSIRDANAIVTALSLTPDEAMAIFFANEVA